MEDQPPIPPSGPPIPPPSQEPPRCSQCGHALMPRATLCPQCGARLTPGPAPLSVLGMIGLGILALLVGGFGACSLLVTPMFASDGAARLLALMFLALGAGSLYLAYGWARRIVRSIQDRRNTR